MRKLERGAEPACLGNYRHGKDNWNGTSKSCRDEIWLHIEEMQGTFCAYCESRLHVQKRHIEHFFRKDDEPKKTFDWNNLFGSCNSSDSCGQYKDHKAKNVNLLKVCKPDSMNPSDYFIFVGDGNVRPKTGLETYVAETALNTIKVFNLNGSPKLVGKRREAMRVEYLLFETYLQEVSDLAMEESSDIDDLFEQERLDNLVRINDAEHSTALRQVWAF